MDVISVSLALVTRKFNVNLEGPFFELRVSPLDNSNMASYHESHMVSNDGANRLGTGITTLSPNEIVKNYITTRSSEFRKLHELRSMVSPPYTHIVR